MNKQQTMYSSPTPKHCLIVSPEAGLITALRPLLAATLPGVPLTHLDHYSIGQWAPQQNSPPVLILVDATANRERALDLFREMAGQSREIQQLALILEHDPEFVLQCLRAGAADFLCAPFSEQHLSAALIKLARLSPSAALGDKTGGKIIVTMPAKGASGASTIAMNLALHAVARKAGRILVADLDPFGGTIAFAAKARSNFSYLDVLRKSSELDSQMWGSLVVRSAGLDLLLAPESVVDVPDDLRDPGLIMNYARKNYDLVIADAAGVYGSWNLYLARSASDLLLVTTNELCSLQAARRALIYLEAHQINREALRLIVSRYHPEFGINLDFVEKAVDEPVYHSLPSDYPSAHRAVLGAAAIPVDKPLGRSLQHLTARVLGRAAAPEKKASGWRRFLNQKIA